MLTVRTGYVDGGEAQDAAKAIAGALRSHPSAARLTGTVIVGCGGAADGAAIGPRPHVAVPVAWLGALDALMRTRIGSADAVVVADAAEVGSIRNAVTPRTIVVVANSGGPEATFLRGAGSRDARAAHDVVASHPELARALPPESLGVGIGDPDAMALACIEAIIAAEAGAPPASGAPQGQG